MRREARRSPDLTAGDYVLVSVTRYRHRHGSRRRGARLRAVLHHEGGRQGHRTRTRARSMASSSSRAATSMIDSRPRLGTTFRLYLPRCDDMRQAVDDREPGRRARRPPGMKRCLSSRTTPRCWNSRSPRSATWAIGSLTAADGPSALDIVQGDEPIDLLFSDVVMPGGMNGFELISKARAIRGD